MTEFSSTIDIQVGMSRPWTHYFEVSIAVTGIVREHLDFVMPVWTPGSYMIREFSRHVRDFAATDGSGEKLAWEKTNKNTWRVYSKEEPRVLVQYRVYAFEVSVRTSFLDDSHGYINGASVFMFVDGKSERPYRLKIVPYPGWTRISTGLDPVSGEPNTFFAPDFDTLADSPVEVGNQQVLEFEFQQIPHFVSLYGDGNCDPARLLSDFRKIVEAAVPIVGQIPYRHYTFLLQLLPEGSGGLEHINSASIQVSRWTFRPEGSYRKFLGLVAHEYFHLWNVKRIRPQGLGPFDYSRETYTRLLWVSEGFTEYYANQILRRSGLITAEQYLEDLSATIHLLGDLLGDRRLMTAVHVSSRLDESAYGAVYVDRTSRWTWGLTVDQEPEVRLRTTGLTADPSREGVFIRDRERRLRIYRHAGAFVAYPLNRSQRIEFSAGLRHIAFDNEHTKESVAALTGRGHRGGLRRVVTGSRCSFCGKRENVVKSLIESPAAGDDKPAAPTGRK